MAVWTTGGGITSGGVVYVTGGFEVTSATAVGYSNWWYQII